jgi:hypothetical protein
VRLAARELPVAWRDRLLRRTGDVWHLAIDRPADLESLLAALRVEGIAVDELTLDEADLEQVFLHIMQSAPQAQAAAVAGTR